MVTGEVFVFLKEIAKTADIPPFLPMLMYDHCNSRSGPKGGIKKNKRVRSQRGKKSRKVFKKLWKKSKKVVLFERPSLNDEENPGIIY